MSFSLVPMGGAGASPYSDYQQQPAQQPVFVPQRPPSPQQVFVPTMQPQPEQQQQQHVMVQTVPSQPMHPMQAQPLQPQCLVPCPPGMSPQQPMQVSQPQQAPVAVPGPYHGFYPYYGTGADEAGKKKRPWYDIFGLCTKGED